MRAPVPSPPPPPLQPRPSPPPQQPATAALAQAWATQCFLHYLAASRSMSPSRIGRHASSGSACIPPMAAVGGCTYVQSPPSHHQRRRTTRAKLPSAADASPHKPWARYGATCGRECHHFSGLHSARVAALLAQPQMPHPLAPGRCLPPVPPPPEMSAVAPQRLQACVAWQTMLPARLGSLERVRSSREPA